MGVAYSVGEVDHLYTFFVQWSPDIYTKGNKKRGRFLVMEEKEVMDGFLGRPGNAADNKWEILRGKDVKRRPSLSSSDGSEPEEQEEDGYAAAVPLLSQSSLLLEQRHLEQLAAHLPVRTQGSRWEQVYSTAVHGSSLKTLYRSTAQLDRPVLLVIRDMQHQKVFGAFCSDPFRVSKYCYGTGETFLFSFASNFQVYRWSGENSYFLNGKLESLQIGGGGDGFALWLDADLYRGASFSCNTFKNAPLSAQQDFLVQDLEVWTVQN